MPTEPSENVERGAVEYPDEIPPFRPIDEASTRRIFREMLAEHERLRSPVFDRVVSDLRRRDELGFQQFGKPIVAGDRDGLREAYEEALDLCVYLRAELDARGDE